MELAGAPKVNNNDEVYVTINEKRDHSAQKMNF